MNNKKITNMHIALELWIFYLIILELFAYGRELISYMTVEKNLFCKVSECCDMFISH